MRWASWATSAPLSDLGKTTPSKSAEANTPRSALLCSLPSGLIRTHHCGPPERAGRALRISRAAALPAGATLSSRSKIIASASLASALAIFFSLSAGTNSQLRASVIAGFFSSSAVRVHSHTSSSRWLKLRWAQVTIPALGRDLLSRTARHSVSLRSVSPANTGLGNTNLS